MKAAADFVQVASEHIGGIKKVGRGWSGLCPFHSEKSPSFSINPELGLYYCFGCQAGGDIVRFVQEVRHLDFVEAIEWLAAKYSIALRYDDVKAGKDRQRRSTLTDAMEAAVAWYHQRLLTGEDSGAARHYLRSRGYDREIVERFSIGWAPGDWDALVKALRLPEDVMRDTGLAFMNRSNRLQDSFRERVLFPIFDTAGKPVAFGGRILPGSSDPAKYKNSSETPIYSKSRTLYALNWAKEDASVKGEIIVCEGYTDVIAFFQAGVPRAVATCGTALADEHFRMLKNFARRIVLAYDADAAGQNAAQRFYEWEQKYEVDVAVAAFPPGSDPGELGRTDPDLLRKAVEEARPFLEFRLDRLFMAADLRSPEGRGRTAETAVDIIAEHPNEFVRDQYVMQVADRCRVDADRVRAALNRPRGRPRPSVAEPARARHQTRPGGDVGPEIEALRLAVHGVEGVAARLDERLFIDEVNLLAFRALRATDTVHDAIATAPSDASLLLQRLAVEETDADADDVVRLLVYASAQRALRRLQVEARQADSPTDYSPTIAWLRVTSEQLFEPSTSIEATGQLVPWLVQFGQEQA